MPKVVMIVEDYEDVRMMMTILIRHQGYTVIEAADGYEAVEQSIRHHPDLILMDLAMPLMDGVTATRLIRKIDGGENILIIALTAFSNISFDKAIEAGFDDLLIKPLPFERIEPLLKQYLS
jgi:CheY-like chemotaxis protein